MISVTDENLIRGFLKFYTRPYMFLQILRVLILTIQHYLLGVPSLLYLLIDFED